MGYIWDTMSDRKNIKVSPDVHEALNDSKPENSTWDGFLDHLLRAYHDPRPRLPPSHALEETEGPGTPLEHVAMGEDRERINERAQELADEVNFAALLHDSDDGSEAAARLIAEMTASRVVEKIEANDDD